MSTDTATRARTTRVLVSLLAAVPLVIAIGLVLRAYGPGDMGTGFLVGAGVALAGAAGMLWRVRRRPSTATTFERAWTQAGDERDDAVLTRALAVLGLVALPLTGAAGIAIGLGLAVEMVIALLIFAEIGVGAVAFAVVNRRS